MAEGFCLNTTIYFSWSVACHLYSARVRKQRVRPSKKITPHAYKSISIEPLLFHKTKNLYNKKLICKAFTQDTSILYCGRKKTQKCVTWHSNFSGDLTINWVWREMCNLYYSCSLVFISKWYIHCTVGKLINALTKSVLYTSEKWGFIGKKTLFIGKSCTSW